MCSKRQKCQTHKANYEHRGFFLWRTRLDFVHQKPALIFPPKFVEHFQNLSLFRRTKPNIRKRLRFQWTITVAQPGSGMPIWPPSKRGPVKTGGFSGYFGNEKIIWVYWLLHIPAKLLIDIFTRVLEIFYYNTQNFMIKNNGFYFGQPSLNCNGRC